MMATIASQLRLRIEADPPRPGPREELRRPGYARCVALCVLSLVVAAVTLFCAPERVWGNNADEVWIRKDSDSRSFVYAIGDSEIVVWDVDKSAVRSRFRLPQSILNDVENPHVKVVLPTAPNRIVLFGIDESAVLNALDGTVVSSRPCSGVMRSYWRDKNKTRVLLDGTDSQGASSLAVVDATSQRVIHRWGFSTKTLYEIFQGWAAIRFHPKGLVCAAGGREDGKLLLWDLKAGKEVWRQPVKYPRFIARFSPDGSTIVVRNDDRPEIRNASNGALLARLQLPEDFDISDAIFSPCGHYVLLSTNSDTMALWDWENNTLKQRYTIPIESKKTQGPARFHYCVLFSPDGKRLVLAGQDLVIYELDTTTATLIAKHDPAIVVGPAKPDVQCSMRLW